MRKSVIAALLFATVSDVAAAPAFAQGAAPANTGAAPAAASATPAGQLSPDQITAFNQSVADFTAAQKLQQAGDNAGALPKYEAALPAIRAAVGVQPDNIDYVGFLANTLYADAAANGALQKFDAIIPLYKEAAPLWRKVSLARPTDAISRNILAGILVQLGNASLTTQDKAGADPYYKEAVDLARKSFAENGSDRIVRNLLLSALIGRSQSSGDAAVMQEAVTMGKTMLADGSIDAVNKPSAEALTGVKSAS